MKCQYLSHTVKAWMIKVKFKILTLIFLLLQWIKKKYVGLTKQGVICIQVFVVANKLNTFQTL